MYCSEGSQSVPARPSGKGRLKTRLSSGKCRVWGNRKWTVGVCGGGEKSQNLGWILCFRGRIMTRF
jgi:hypothetical protein